MSFASLLSDPLLSLWSQPVTGLEIIAFVTGLASVWLTYRMHVANWPLGMVSVGCYAWLFFTRGCMRMPCCRSPFWFFALTAGGAGCKGAGRADRSP